MLVVNVVVNVMAAYQPVVQVCGTPYTARLLVCRHNIVHVSNDQHNRIIIVALAKHEVAPWWWFLREPKHVRAIIGILIDFNIPVIL